MEQNLRRRRAASSRSNAWSGISVTSEKNYPTCSLSPAVGFLIIVAFILSLKLFLFIENEMPKQISLREANDHPGRFIGERAQLILKRLTDLGTRVVGSYENEVLAVDFFKREISYISQEASDIFKIELDIQNCTGSYLMYKKFRNYYSNIQNVVVKLNSSNSKNSLLLNCHYDTVPESPGASDNGINCAVMLEILRVLSSGKKPFKNNIIFLFNGAEENPMQGSHGFLSHKWSKEVKVVINLDSAGAGGKEMLFQTSGEPWLAKAFAKSVRRPNGGVHAEELFQSGIIPSDTDFRIFRNYGNISGYDIAHSKNGYVYHTKCDRMDFIKPGVYQNTGDNILALTKEIANSLELGKDQSKKRVVYFDFFNFFLVFYEESFGIVLNLITIALSLFSIFKCMDSLTGTRKFLKSLAISAGVQCLVLISGFLAVFFISKILDTMKSTMSWHLRPWLLIPLYEFPILLASLAVLLLVQAQMKKDLPEHNVIRFINGAQLLWTIFLLMGTFFGIRSSYILMIFTLGPSIGSLIIIFVRKFSSVKMYLASYMCCLIVPSLFILHIIVRLFISLIPMTARMGPSVNSEAVMGGLVFITSTLYVTLVIPVFLLLRKIKYIFISLTAFHVLAMSAVIFTKFGFPYDGNLDNPAFQRVYVYHTERIFYDIKGSVEKTDSGYFIQTLDRNNINYLSKEIPELEEALPTIPDCSSEIFCGFPLYTFRYLKTVDCNYYVPADPPTFTSPLFFEVISRKEMSQDIIRITVLITGPDHITVGFSPMEKVQLVGWSFNEFYPLKSEMTWGRNTYMVHYSHGLGGRLTFHFDLKVNKDKKEPIVQVAVIGHYMHKKKLTQDFKSFVSRFPKWVHVTHWVNKYERWLI